MPYQKKDGRTGPRPPFFFNVFASLSVCDLIKIQTRPKVTCQKNHISGTVPLRVTKLGQGMDVDDLEVYLEGQGHRSKVKVTSLKNYFRYFKNHISGTVPLRVTKFGKGDLEVQGHRSKVRSFGRYDVVTVSLVVRLYPF